MEKLKKNFLLIGGDYRQIYAANYLKNRGFSVSLYGFGEIDDFSFSDTFDCLVLPAPFSKDHKNIFAPLSDFTVPISDIKKFNAFNFIVGGGFDGLFCETFGKDLKVFDLLKVEEYNILNAVSSAEGAISIAIKETAFNLKGAEVLALGFGKIGKLLSLDLKGLGAKVSVAARKESDRALAKSFGLFPFDYGELAEHINKFDIVFNTVPSLIINEDIIKRLKKSCLILDLASKPGGCDFKKADEYGIKNIHALGLPGIYSPETSGRIVAEITLKLTSGK